LAPKIFLIKEISFFFLRIKECCDGFVLSLLLAATTIYKVLSKKKERTNPSQHSFILRKKRRFL